MFLLLADFFFFFLFSFIPFFLGGGGGGVVILQYYYYFILLLVGVGFIVGLLKLNSYTWYIIFRINNNFYLHWTTAGKSRSSSQMYYMT